MKRYIGIAMIAGLLVLAPNVSATMITYAMIIPFPGDLPPSGTAPWLTAIFDDHGGMGSVDLTITATNLTGNEKVWEVYFNIDPELEQYLGSLDFGDPTTVAGEFAPPTVSKNLNHYKADGDGFFDIEVAFAHNDGTGTTFETPDAVKYTITGISSLTANSFDFLSSATDNGQAGGEGLYKTAAHIQALSGGASTWISVPEPATMAILGLGGLLFARRK
jgi:hypothetical protein